MAKYRQQLPQCAGGFFVTDGGIETTLIFQQGLVLPEFAAFHLLRDEKGEEALRRYYRSYAQLARQFELGFILESPTWRASRDWGLKLGYSLETLDDANRKAVWLMEAIRAQFESGKTPMVISGNLGPRGDGYVPSKKMSASAAAEYHLRQIMIFSQTEADMIAAFTMNYVEEAIGIAKAAESMRMPAAISFTVETDGKLPAGQSLKEAIEATDQATDGYPVYYMINCAHPAHFMETLQPEGPWLSRIRGIRANASKKSHAELNEAVELDAGDRQELAGQYRNLKTRLKDLCVVGGCCGTDRSHIEEICKAMPLPGNCKG